MTDQHDEDYRDDQDVRDDQGVRDDQDAALRQAQGPDEVSEDAPDPVSEDVPDEGPELVEGPEPGHDDQSVAAEPSNSDQPESSQDDQPGDPEPMIAADPTRTPEELQSALEALLLVADEPVSETALAATLNTPTDEITAALAELVRFYDETGRGFELRAVAGGWRYYTREQHAELLSGYVLEGQHAKLSQAALETLAVIAYLQPVSRSRVSGVRGVSVDGVMRTLLARDLITEIGAEDSGATLFATTDYFLERMGLQSLDELPEIAPYLPEATELEAELGQLAVVPDPTDESDAPDPVPDLGDATEPDAAEGPDPSDEFTPSDELDPSDAPDASGEPELAELQDEERRA